MLLEIIHPDFRIDLRNKELSVVEENSWFNDRFFVKYTYPVTIEITKELEIALGLPSIKERATPQSYWEVKFLIEGNVHDALFVIEKIIGLELTVNISFGLEELPNWDKDLASLPLEVIEIPGDFYAYAETIITESYPTVNFNFPKIKTPEDVFKTDEDKWVAYQGYINNYSNGIFIENEYDSVNDIQLNRNIMQPMPYLLHVLKTGFIDAGYALTGDILDDPELNKAVVLTISDYYSSINPNSYEIILNTNDYISTVTRPDPVDAFATQEFALFYLQQTITTPGRYKLAGSVYVRVKGSGYSSYTGTAEIKLNGETVWNTSVSDFSYKEGFTSINIDFDIFTGDAPVILEFLSEQFPYQIIDNSLVEGAVICDLTFTEIALYDAQDIPQPTLVVPSKINLRKCVPEMTFGELFKAIKNYRNYNLKIEGDLAIVNKIEREMVELPKIDISDFEIKNPLLFYFGDEKYYLKFENVENKLFDNRAILVTRNGGDFTLKKKPEGAKEIIIKLFPLPQEIGAEGTAVLLFSKNTKLQIAIYDGLSGDLNVTGDPSALSLINSYEEYYKKWLSFRISSTKIEQSFICSPELSRKLNVFSELQMYNGRYIPRKLTKVMQSKDQVKVSIEIYRNNSF